MDSLRDPYPYPRKDNDNSFGGYEAEEICKDREPTHLAQNRDPWNRLNANHTLSSVRRTAMHYDPEAPNDNLDYVLKTVYDQHAELFKTQPQVKLQPETAGLDHGRVLKNRIIVPPTEVPELNHPLIHAPVGRAEDLNSIKNAIVSQHAGNTKNGYSRKTHDGGFFMV